jgi:hypothetical protein
MNAEDSIFELRLQETTYKLNACKLARRLEVNIATLTTPAQTITPFQRNEREPAQAITPFQQNECEKRLPWTNQMAQLHRTPSQDRHEDLLHA